MFQYTFYFTFIFYSILFIIVLTGCPDPADGDPTWDSITDADIIYDNQDTEGGGSF